MANSCGWLTCTSIAKGWSLRWFLRRRWQAPEGRRPRQGKEIVMVVRLYRFAAGVCLAVATCASIGTVERPAYADGEDQSYCDLKDSGTNGGHSYYCATNCSPCNLGSDGNGQQQCTGCP